MQENKGEKWEILCCEGKVTDFFLPNPNKGNFVLEGRLKANQTNAEFVITDMNGKIVLREVVIGNSFRKVISLNTSSGIYLYSLKSEKEVLYRGKIVIR